MTKPLPTLTLRIETWQVNPPKPAGFMVFDGDRKVGVISLEEFEARAAELRRLLAARAPDKSTA